jgi:tetratricopeptide (TPR) repeat protein
MSTGEARSRAGDFGAAAAAFEQAARIRETSQSRAALGRALSDAGRPADALGELRRATELDPTNGDAWLALGQVQLAGGDPAGARASYERNLAVDPDGRNAGEVRAALARLRP